MHNILYYFCLNIYNLSRIITKSDDAVAIDIFLLSAITIVYHPRYGNLLLYCVNAFLL